MTVFMRWQIAQELLDKCKQAGYAEAWNDSISGAS